MKRIIACVLSLITVFTLLPGCSRIIERDYSYSEPHAQEYTEQADGQILVVDDYEGLRSALLYYINALSRTAQIRLSNYSGNITEDVSAVCLDVVRTDPLASFCVDYISHEYSRIVSFYEVTFTITYTRTRQEIDSIRHVYSSSAAREALKAAYSERKESLYLRCYYYDGWAEQLQAYLEQFYYDLPDCALLMPELVIQAYPEECPQLILEVKINYETSSRVQMLRKEMLSTLSAKVAEELGLYDINTQNREEVVQALFDIYTWLYTNVRYDETAEDAATTNSRYRKTSSFTAYGAFYVSVATSEGYALAFKLLCDLAGIDCSVVVGRRNNLNCCWNIVTVGNKKYHIDPSAPFVSSLEEGFLRSDSSLSETYRWNLSSYPICPEDYDAADLIDAFLPPVTDDVSDDVTHDLTIVPDESDEPTPEE
ncbi:MAG: hypothetical protein IKM51_02410 [Oscillospiraceae bacterium]|nr:hypothetical protein [Oscillospiraceae bacterium]